MAESTYTSVQTLGPVTLAKVTLDKVTDREAPVVLREVTSGAMATKYRVALDLSSVKLLASAGLGMLVSLNKACKDGGGVLCVFGVADEIMQVLKITNLHRLVSIVDSRDAAVKKVTP